MSPFEYCREKAAPDGSSLYYCLQVAPSDVAPALLALLALERELDEVVEQTSDAAIAMTKLEFWARELEALDTHARHPVSLALAQSGAAQHLRSEERHRVIEATTRRVRIAQVQSIQELTALCDDSTGLSMAIASRVEGATVDEEQTARALGSACGAAGYVFARPRAGQPPHTAVPLSLLREHDAHPHDIDRAADAEPVRRVRDALAAWAEQALDDALAEPAPRVARARARLARAELAARLAGRRGLTPLRKLWIARRTQDTR